MLRFIIRIFFPAHWLFSIGNGIRMHSNANYHQMQNDIYENWMKIVYGSLCGGDVAPRCAIRIDWNRIFSEWFGAWVFWPFPVTGAMQLNTSPAIPNMLNEQLAISFWIGICPKHRVKYQKYLKIDGNRTRFQMFIYLHLFYSLIGPLMCHDIFIHLGCIQIEKNHRDYIFVGFRRVCIHKFTQFTEFTHSMRTE